MAIPPPPARGWQSPEDVLAVGLNRSRVVMINEAHNGLTRCVRTRRLGVRLLPVAHQAGVRWFAMEALIPAVAAEANETRRVPAAAGGYLAQAELRELIATALGLGWRLLAYEADFTRKPPELAHLSVEESNWREAQQACNLCAALETIPDDEALLVWCGNSHLAKHASGDWIPMGVHFTKSAAVEAFAIDQTATVEFAERDPYAMQWIDAYASEIEALGGAAGFLTEEAPDGWPSSQIADAFILALENDLE